MKKIFPFIKTLAFLILLSGCSIDASLNYAFVAAVSGYVYDAKTGNGISGATVTFKDANGATVKSADTDFTGKYSLSEIDQGRYIVVTTKGSVGQYAFAPLLQDVPGRLVNLPNIMGFPTAGLGDGTVTIVVTWDGDVTEDVDANITIPPAGLTGNDTFQAYGSIGEANFSPDEAAVSSRILVNPVNKTPAGNRGVEFVSATNSINMETITLPPAISGAGGKGVTSGIISYPDIQNGDIWRGVLEYYLDGKSDNMADISGVGANVKVYVFQDADVLGVYSLPSFTNIDKASVLRIHAFDWGYMIFPQIQAVTEFRSVNKPYIVTKHIHD